MHWSEFLAIDLISAMKPLDAVAWCLCALIIGAYPSFVFARPSSSFNARRIGGWCLEFLGGGVRWHNFYGRGGTAVSGVGWWG